MTPPLPIQDGVFAVDNTKMTGIRRCARYGWHQTALNRVPARESEDLFFGKALHAAQEWRYKKCGSRAMTGEEKAAQEAVLEKQFEGIEIVEDNWQNLGRAKESIAYWNEEFQGEPFQVLETERGVARELGYVICPACHGSGIGLCLVCLKSGVVKINYNGRIDALVCYERKVLGHDYKKMKDRDWKVEQVKYAMSPQLRGYCFLASTLGHGPVNDWWIDSMVCRKPLSRETAKSAARNEFSRDQYHFTDESIEEWRRDTLAIIETWLGYCAQGAPPMNLDACTQFFKPCAYFDVCSLATEQQRSAWLQSGAFKDGTFDPMAK